jgi:hypothetical protein
MSYVARLKRAFVEFQAIKRPQTLLYIVNPNFKSNLASL